jgi:hypothetical protein
MESFSEWLTLQEMPMTLTKVGDWAKPHEGKERWDSRSHRVFNSGSALSKIQRIMDRSLHNFNVYAIRSPNSNHTFSPDGSNLPISMANSLYSQLGISPKEAPIDPNKINVFLVSWRDEPPTGWMILHRFAHMSSNLYSWDANEALKRNIKASTGGPQQIMAFQSVLTMRSARNGQVNNIEEGIREAFAQYLLTGKVTLESRGQYSSIVNIPQLQNDLNDIFRQTMDQIHKYIYVM